MELINCPYCGHDKIATEEMDLLGQGEMCLHAVCFACGASAPADKWNARFDGWIKTSDKLPGDKDPILMYTNTGQMFSGRGVVLKSKLEPRKSGGGIVSDYYTHWQPMPGKPTS